MLPTIQHLRPQEDDTATMEACICKVQALVKESNLSQAYQTLQSPMVCASLNIPSAIWNVLEPQLKEKINKIRANIRSKEAQTPSGSIPDQYPSQAQRINAMVSKFCSEVWEGQLGHG